MFWTPVVTLALRRLAATMALGLGLGAAQATPPAFENTLAQRLQACTGCHGLQGRAGPDGYYPRLAGKPAGYLYQQLQNFRDQRRLYRPMNHLLNGLPDAYLMEIARHFAALEVAYPAPASHTASRAEWQRGQQLVQHGDPARQLPACTACHGVALTGLAPNVPGLLGLPRDYLNSQLGAWRSGQRHAQAPDCMAEVAQRLDLADVAALSSWLAAQPVPADSHPATRLPAPPPLRCGAAHVRGMP